MVGALPEDFHQLVERASDLILIVREARIVYANPAFAQALGYSRDELLGTQAVALAHPAERAQVEQRMAATAAGASFSGGRRRLVRRDGNVLEIESSVFPTRFGGEAAVVLIGRDLTDRLQLEAEAARKDTEYRDLFRALPGVVGVFSMEGSIRYLNDAAIETLQLKSMEAARGLSVEGLFEQDERKAGFALALDRARRDEVIPAYERRALAKDGTARLLLLGTCSVRFEGEPARLAIGYDVTSQREAEERANARVRETTETLRAIFDASPQAILALDLRGNVTLWSGAAEWILGLSAQEATGRPAPFLEPGDGPVRAAMQAALAGEPLSIESSLSRAGADLALSLSFGALKGAQGEPAGCVVVVADVSARRKLEREAAAFTAALQRADDEWRATFDAVDAAVLVIDPATFAIARMNLAAAVLAAIPDGDRAHLQDLRGTEPWRTVATAVPQVSRTRKALLRNAQEAGRTWLISLSPARSWPGAGEAVIVLVRDISELVALQDTLRRTEAMTAMGSLVAGVAHEVRNPLFGMSASLDAMQSRLGPSEVAAPFMTALRRELERLNELMRDLLEFGKPLGAALVPEALLPVVAAAVRACQPVADEARVLLENALEAAGEVPMDPGRLVQVFQNLIDNAIRHSPPGAAVRIECSPARLGQAEAIEVRVIDRGPGFSARDLPRLFEPFFTRRRGGIGLGLAIVQRIVEQHGGTVEPRNQATGGAVVAVRLPRSATR